MATECSWNDGSKAQYYVVILDRLLDRSGGLERAPEWRVRGPLTHCPLTVDHRHYTLQSQGIIQFGSPLSLPTWENRIKDFLN